MSEGDAGTHIFSFGGYGAGKFSLLRPWQWSFFLFPGQLTDQSSGFRFAYFLEKLAQGEGRSRKYLLKVKLTCNSFQCPN